MCLPRTLGMQVIVWIHLPSLSAIVPLVMAMTLSRELACSSKLLSHTIVFWAFCKALYYFGRKITMEGYVRAPWECLVPAVWGFALSWWVLRKPPQPRPRRMSSFNISFQFTAAGAQRLRKELDYNTEERLHLMPFCYWLRAVLWQQVFERIFAYTCTQTFCILDNSPKAPDPQTSTVTCWFLHAQIMWAPVLIPL